MVERDPVYCHDTRPCFARESRNILYSKFKACKILTEGYQNDGECPFCKPLRDVTKGETHVYIPR